jgi:hypothetical protein
MEDTAIVTGLVLSGFRFFFQNRNVYSRGLMKKLSRGGQAHNASADD